MRPVICMEMLYPEETASHKIERIADHGFDAIEFWGWKDKNIPAIAETCSRRGVRVANFSGHRVGSPIAVETHAAVLDDFREALGVALELGCPTLMFLSNELGADGRVLDSYPNLSDEEKRKNFVALLRVVAAEAPPNLTLVIEPLNTIIDHEGNYLKDMSSAAEIVRAVGSPRVRILCDLYHMGVMGANLEELLRSYAPLIGYIHIADFPGRHEPGTGTVDWRGVMKVLREIEYQGDVGFEFAPARDSDRSLDSIRSLMIC